MPGKHHPSKRAGIYWLPRELLDRMSRGAAELGLTQTEFVRRAIEHELAGRR